MPILYQKQECVAVSGTLQSGSLGDIVKITGDYTFAPATAGTIGVGWVSWRPLIVPGVATIETFGMKVLTCDFGGAVVAGEYVKIGTPGTSGNQRVIKWISGTDAESLKIGICLSGGSTDGSGDILI